MRKLSLVVLLAIAGVLGAQILGPIMGGSPVCCTYYISNTGSDAANGLTPATAWQTIAKVNAAMLTAGQSVGFKRGGTWRETLTPGQSGTSGTPITFAAYGSGANPVISGADLMTPWLAASAGAVNQSDTVAASSGNGLRQYDATYYLAQGVIPSASGTVPQIDLWMKKLSSPSGYLSVEIWTNVAGVPGAMISNGASSAVAASTVTGTYGWISFGFPTPPTVTSGTTYHIVAKASYATSSSAYVQWGKDFGATYSGAAPTCNFYGSAAFAWTGEAADSVFRLYVTQALPNVYTTVAATGPKMLAIDGTVGHLKGSVGVLASDNDWYWASNTLYLYSTADPSAKIVEAAVRDDAILVFNKSYLNFANLAVRYAANNFEVFATVAAFGFRLSGLDSWRGGENGYIFAGGAAISDITISTSTADHCGQTPTGGGGASGFSFSPAANSAISNLTMVNNTASYTGVAEDGSTVETYKYGFNINKATGVTLIGNVAHHNAASGIYLQQGTSNASVLGGSSHDNGQAGSADMDGISLGGLGANWSNVVIDNVELYSNGENGIQAATTDVLGVGDNVTIRNVYAHANVQAGIKCAGGHTNVVVHHNVSAANGTSGYYHSRTIMDAGEPTAVLYENTLYGNATANIYVGAGGLTMKNNVTSEGVASEVIVESAKTLAASDYNLFYHSAGGNFMSYQGTATTFAGWKTATSKDGSSKSANPLFTNAGAGDYTLQPGSPAIGTGVYIPGVSTANPPNIGAK